MKITVTKLVIRDDLELSEIDTLSEVIEDVLKVEANLTRIKNCSGDR